jgi:hypothetical protein
MRLTKLGHACVRLDKDGAVLVIDPGAFSDPAALSGADAVLITHEHFDHIVPDQLRAALDADPGLHLWSTAAVAEQFAHLGVRVHPVSHGDTFSAPGLTCTCTVPSTRCSTRTSRSSRTPVSCSTARFSTRGTRLPYPRSGGDAAAAGQRAWLKLSEMIDYGRAVAPRRAYTIHDALLSETGLQVLDNFLGMAVGAGGGTFSQLADGASIDL